MRLVTRLSATIVSVMIFAACEAKDDSVDEMDTVEESTGEVDASDGEDLDDAEEVCSSDRRVTLTPVEGGVPALGADWDCAAAGFGSPGECRFDFSTTVPDSGTIRCSFDECEQSVEVPVFYPPPGVTLTIGVADPCE